ncbi:hypothetical protein [Agromyces albus]|uniref:D-glucuronyl C5-epimerase C-terminal domain-containing protein n=1 Tax=Agromyces albus TaxID=205332 RepID=A0A4Q2KRH9_9MICO|nr:hypothetical protein [Agromyces albus]RXZ68018.1 hypothetical protein ESP51_15300 [Agromyces albus]
MTTDASRRPRWATLALGLAAALALTGGLTAPAHAEPAAPEPLANTAHLDFLLDTASPAEVPGHTTYRLAEEPELVLPWTYADARDGGTFERVGGGPLDPVTGDWGQGAYNADDVSRAAVVYLRHWQQTGDEASRVNAYELLRSLAYLQTADGEHAGNVVLWMQPDGDLNPSAEPVELPDPSDSDASYWLARTIWAFGEGFAAFADTDPDFAAFLADRLGLARDAVDRQVLDRYGEYEISDGMKVPAWLIVDGADATAEAVLGLAAYVEAAPGDEAARTTLERLAEGIAAMGAGDTESWPYGAILPWALSRSMWHAWGSQMPAALAEASVALDDAALLEPAIADSTGFTTTLLTAGGPDNGWFPTPADRVQIAYGADSRVQSLLSVADASGSSAFEELAAMQAAWFFGANRAGEPMYDPATGITFDGIQPDGSINRNSGAESTIHGLLTMIALDASPEIAQRATTVTDVAELDGLRVIEAESTTSTTGSVEAPASAWTGESLISGDVLVLDRGENATFDLGTAEVPRSAEPVAWLPEGARARSIWSAGRTPAGVLDGSGEPQGISPASGVLLPRQLQSSVPGTSASLTARVEHGTVTLDALLVRPSVSRLVLDGSGGTTELVHSTSQRRQQTEVGFEGAESTVRVYDDRGVLQREQVVNGRAEVLLPSGGFAVITR